MNGKPLYLIKYLFRWYPNLNYKSKQGKENLKNILKQITFSNWLLRNTDLKLK